ncbi:MAG: hypothetical protein ACREBE_25675, partial [bacterium]
MLLEALRQRDRHLGPQQAVEVHRVDPRRAGEVQAHRERRIPARPHLEQRAALDARLRRVQVPHHQAPVVDLDVALAPEVRQPAHPSLQRVVERLPGRHAAQN